MKESKCQFFTKRLEILVQIVTPEGLSADPLELRMMFEFPEPKDKKQLQVFIEIGKYLSKVLPHLASVAAILPDLQGTRRT